MPAINQNSLKDDPGFLYWCSGLLGYCYANGIERPWLGDMVRNELLIDGGTTTARPSTATAPAGSFDDAVLAAVTSSPMGVDFRDLVAILKHHSRPNNQIGASLKRLAGKGLITGRGNLWRAKSNGSAARRVASVTTAGQTAAARQQRRPQAGTQAGAEAGTRKEGAEEQRPAAAA